MRENVCNINIIFFFEKGKKKQSFLGFTGKRAILHWATKILVVHPCISEIDSTAAVAYSGYANAMNFWSLPYNTVEIPELPLHYLLLDIAGLKTTVGMSSVLSGVLNICIFSVCVEMCTAFSRIRSLKIA